MMNANKFYSKKLELLGHTRRLLDEALQAVGSLGMFETTHGDPEYSEEVYAKLYDDLDALYEEISAEVDAVKVLVNAD